MSDFSLALESSEEIRDYNVADSIFENQVDETRLISAGVLIGFKCRSPALNSTRAKAYTDFFDGKYGSLTPFTFTSRMNSTEYTVRFEKGSFKIINEQGYFRCEFNLKRVF